MTAPGWYLERPVAALDEILLSGGVTPWAFSIDDAALLHTSLGLDESGGVNALALVAARLALLDGRRMPAGATMVGIRWVQRRPFTVPSTVAARCQSVQSEDSRGRIWVETGVLVSECHPNGDHELAEVTFTFLWPAPTTAGGEA